MEKINRIFVKVALWWAAGFMRGIGKILDAFTNLGTRITSSIGEYLVVVALFVTSILYTVFAFAASLPILPCVILARPTDEEMQNFMDLVLDVKSSGERID